MPIRRSDDPAVVIAHGEPQNIIARWQLEGLIARKDHLHDSLVLLRFQRGIECVSLYANRLSFVVIDADAAINCGVLEPVVFKIKGDGVRIDAKIDLNFVSVLRGRWKYDCLEG